MPTQPYEIEGEKIPSVTQILGMLGWKTYGLTWWAWNLGKEGKDLRGEREALATVGTLAHAMAACHIRGHDPEPVLEDVLREEATKVRGAFDAYLAWRNSTKLELVGSEVSLVSATHRFGGTMDAVGMLAGAPALLDFKSAKALYPDVIVQLAAYSALWDEHHPDLFIRSWHVLRWAEDGSFAHHSIPERKIQAGWEVFKHARAIYDLKKTIEGKERRAA